MGVKGLWTLLEPVGRRIDVEAISNKRLAVDASIWLFQFMRAMRNDQGEMIKNAHLLGFFRRICRLLFHKVQPIFVFEGTTPALKRATTAARRARREFHSAALKRAAEKLLVNQIKQHALLEAQRQREQQQQQRREAAIADEAQAAVAGKAQKRRKFSPAVASTAAELTPAASTGPGSFTAAPGPAIGTNGTGRPSSAQLASLAVAGPSSSKHMQQQPQQQTNGLYDSDTDLEDLQLAAALEASAAAAADPKGKRPAAAAAAEGSLPERVVQLLKQREQQYLGQPPAGADASDAQAGTLDGKTRVRFAQEEADAELARELEQQLNNRPAAAVLAGEVCRADSGDDAGALSEQHLRQPQVTEGEDAMLAAALAASEAEATAGAASAAAHSDEDEAPLQFQHAAGSSKRAVVQEGDGTAPNDQPQRSRRSQPAAAQEQQHLLRAIALKRRQQQRKAGGPAEWEPDDFLDAPGEDKFTKMLNLTGPEFVGGGGRGAGQNSDAASSESDDDGDAAGLLLPADVGSLDPAVLSTLPQSVQLDILEKMRDAQQAANRDKFLQAAAAPQTFSQVQMETYLKASRFRQQIQRHKRTLGGGVQGPQEAGEELRGRHMASEHTREFVFAKQHQPAAGPAAAADVKPPTGITAASGGFTPGLASQNPSRAASWGATSHAANNTSPSTKTKAPGYSPNKPYGSKRKRKFDRYLDDLEAAARAKPQAGFKPGVLPQAGLEGVKGLAAFSSVLKQWGDGAQPHQGAPGFEPQGTEGQQEVEYRPAGLVEPVNMAAVAVKLESPAAAGVAVAVHNGSASAGAPVTVAARPGAAVGDQSAAVAVIDLATAVTADDEALFAGLADSSSEEDSDIAAAEDPPAGLGKGSAAGHVGVADAAAQPAAATASDEEDWEDVEPASATAAAAAASQQQPHSVSQSEPSQSQQPQQKDSEPLPVWRERMAVRHKFWSTSHGFKLGRKLGDWAAAESLPVEPAAAAAVPGPLGAAAAAVGGAVAAALTGALHRSPVKAVATRRVGVGGGESQGAVVSDDENDADVQQAIELSLAAAAAEAANGVRGTAAVAGEDQASREQQMQVDMIADASEDWEDVGASPAAAAVPAAATPAITHSLGQTPKVFAEACNAEADVDDWEDVDAATAPTASPLKAAQAAAVPEPGATGRSCAVAQQVPAVQPAAPTAQQQPQQQQQQSTLSPAEPLQTSSDSQQRQLQQGVAFPSVQQPGNPPSSSKPSAAASLAARINANSSRQLEDNPAVAPRDAQAVAALHRDLSAAAQVSGSGGERAETAAARADEAAAAAGIDSASEPSQDEIFATLREVEECAAAPVASAAAGTFLAPDTAGATRTASADAVPVRRATALEVATTAAAVVPISAYQPQQQPDALHQDAFDFSFVQEPVLKLAKTPAAPGSASRLRPKAAAAATAGTTGSTPPLHVGRANVPVAAEPQQEEFVQAVQHPHAAAQGAVVDQPQQASAVSPPQQHGRDVQQEQQQQQQQPPGSQQQQRQPLQLPQVQEPLQHFSIQDTSAQQQRSTSGVQQQQQQEQQQPVPASAGQVSVTPVDIESELAALAAEQQQLKSTVASAARNTATPTEEMTQECQELLTLFGIPFIVAPAEAEAQCAWLEAAGLVDGVVTDDNDAFLFGSQHVYRHLFADKKYVEEYHMSDISKELGVSREQLVCLALLLGSDYTEGVAGIGVVNALEVVSAWPGGIAGLTKFRQWLEGPDERLVAAAKRAIGASNSKQKQPSKQRTKRQKQGTVKSTDKGAEGGSNAEAAAADSDSDGRQPASEADMQEGSVSVSAGAKQARRGRGRGRGRGLARSGKRQRSKVAAAAPDNNTDRGRGSDVEVVGERSPAHDGSQQQAEATATVTHGEEDTPAQREFKKAHKGVRKAWQLPASFPSSRVAEAYTTPLVDRNPGKFSFGRPDTSLLQQFCRERFGWDQTKIDELLLPVLRSYSERSTQLRMDQFLTHKQRFAKIKSKRLQQAVAKITGVEVNPELFYAEVRHLPELAAQGAAVTPGAGSDATVEEPVMGSQGAGVQRRQLSDGPSAGRGVSRGRGASIGPMHRRGRGRGRRGGGTQTGVDTDDDMGSAESDLAFARLMQATAD